MDFDLFKLHVPEEDVKPKSWICVKGKELNNQLSILIKEITNKNKITKKRLANILSKNLSCSQSPIESRIYKLKDWIPLIVINKLLRLWQTVLEKNEIEIQNKKIELQESFDWLKQSVARGKQVKAVKRPNKTLCKIAGAHAADGNLAKNFVLYSKNESQLKTVVKREFSNNFKVLKRGKFYRSNWIHFNHKEKVANLIKTNSNILAGCMYQLELVEHHKEAVQFYSNWIFDTFGIKSTLTRKHDAWHIKIRNKVISRYFNLFLDFPYGPKTEIVTEPKIIQNASLEFRRCFACGALTFDGSVSQNMTVRFSSKSKSLIKSIKEIGKLDDVDFRGPIKTKQGLFILYTKRSENVAKLLDYFAVGTKKWYKLYVRTNGFEGKVKSLKNAEESINYLFPRQGNTTLAVLDTFNTIKNINNCDIAELLDYLKDKNIEISKSQLYYQLMILKKMCILKIYKRKKNRQNIYEFNPKINTWKLPLLEFKD